MSPFPALDSHGHLVSSPVPQQGRGMGGNPRFGLGSFNNICKRVCLLLQLTALVKVISAVLTREIWSRKIVSPLFPMSNIKTRKTPCLAMNGRVRKKYVYVCTFSITSWKGHGGFRDKEHGGARARAHVQRHADFELKKLVSNHQSILNLLVFYFISFIFLVLVLFYSIINFGQNKSDFSRYAGTCSILIQHFNIWVYGQGCARLMSRESNLTRF